MIGDLLLALFVLKFKGWSFDHTWGCSEEKPIKEQEILPGGKWTMISLGLFLVFMFIFGGGSYVAYAAYHHLSVLWWKF